MVGVVQKRLKRLFERQRLVPEGRDIGGQIKALCQQQHCLRRHGHGAIEHRLGIQADVLPQEINTLGHIDLTAIPRLIRGLERGGIICYTVADCTEIAHIDDTDHVAQEYAGCIGDLNIIHPHNRAICAFDIDAKMPINRGGPPGHIHTPHGSRYQRLP